MAVGDLGANEIVRHVNSVAQVEMDIFVLSLSPPCQLVVMKEQ